MAIVHELATRGGDKQLSRWVRRSGGLDAAQGYWSDGRFTAINIRASKSRQVRTSFAANARHLVDHRPRFVAPIDVNPKPRRYIHGDSFEDLLKCVADGRRESAPRHVRHAVPVA